MLRVSLDGRVIGDLARPGPRNPRSRVRLDPATAVVFEWRPAWHDELRIDVFRDDISLLDGRTFEEVWQAEPRRAGMYDMRLRRDAFRVSLPGIFLGLTLVGASVLGGSRAGVGGGMLVGLALATWIAAWVVAVRSVHTYNLTHRELGAKRWLLLGIVAAGYPFASLLVLVAAYHPSGA